MQNNIFTKITDYKIFGITVFQKIEAEKSSDFETKEVYKVFIRPDYYKSEFEE